jgi:subtilisin family serine protease
MRTRFHSKSSKASHEVSLLKVFCSFSLIFFAVPFGGPLLASAEPSSPLIIPGQFLAVAKREGSVQTQPSSIELWAKRLRLTVSKIRGFHRLYEISGAEGYQAAQLLGGSALESPWEEVVPNSYLEIEPSEPMEETRSSFRVFAGLVQALDRLQFPFLAAPSRYPAELVPGKNWALEQIGAPQAWTKRTNADDIVVAILDSGVDITHPDLKENLWVNPGEVPANGVDDDQNGWVDDIHGYDSHYEKVEVQDQVGHGTFLAGIIGAVGNNGVGTTGVAWKAKLMVVLGDDHRRMSWMGAVKGAYHARDNGAKIINASLGTYSATTGLREMVRDMEASGVWIVNAVGNNSNNVDTQYRAYPSGCATSNPLVVTALHPNRQLVQYADHGEKYVHLAAPGWGGATTLLGGGYGVQAGCSVAAPYVTGAAALLWAEHPEWTYRELRVQLLQAVDVLPSLRGKVATSGVLNIGRALGVN